MKPNTEAKHTPGPWGVRTNPDRTNAVYIDAQMGTPGAHWIRTVAQMYAGNCDETAADARLIAAAPEQNAALLGVSEAVGFDDASLAYLALDELLTIRIPARALVAVRAAIAKAEGR